MGPPAPGRCTGRCGTLLRSDWTLPFGDTRPRGETDQHAEGNADAGAVFKHRPDEKTEARSKAHALCTAVAVPLFTFLFLCPAAGG